VAKEFKAGDNSLESSSDTIDPGNVLNPDEIQALPLTAAASGFERTFV
jgi:hypothetical protein